jgi:glyoxylase-like metal-dependent hydrolase (beta-lactamase superfamily II)
MEIYLLHPATFRLDGGAMFGIIPKPLWEKKIQPDELNRIPMSLRCVLIKTKNKNILIDTGIGDYHDEKFQKNFDIQTEASPLEQALRKADLNASDITDVILTHLHFDHVGGLTKKVNGEIKTVFENATLHMHEKHYEYSQNATLRDGGSFHAHTFVPVIEAAIKNNKVNFLNESEGVILTDGDEKVEYKTSFGHTPYMIHPIFNGHIYMADLVPMSHHVHVPWVMGYDIEPAVTTEYKQKFYDKITKEDLTLIFEHDIPTWGGKLKINEKKKYVLDPAFESSKELCERI